jgi:hypothetical protein
VDLEDASMEAAGTGTVPVPLAVGSSDPLGFFDAAGWASKCPAAMVPTVTSFSPWETWTRWSSAGWLIVLPSLTLLRGPFFSGERCRRIQPSSRPLSGRPATTPAYTAPAST